MTPEQKCKVMNNVGMQLLESFCLSKTMFQREVAHVIGVHQSQISSTNMKEAEEIRGVVINYLKELLTSAS